MPLRVPHPNFTRGFTLVELLVVIAIIGILVALLLPAVQAARESARRNQCQNHVRQMGLAFILHEEAHGFYPSSGWGYKWVGDPDMGVGQSQPGGWAFDILAFMEETATRTIGQGLPPAEKREALAALKAQPVSLFHCPSRRPAIGYPSIYERSFNSDEPSLLAKTDYAANGGSRRRLGSGPTPGCDQTYPNCSWGDAFSFLERSFNGISGEISEVAQAQLTDGTSKTFMLAEKYLNPNDYMTGNDGADNNSVYQGNDWDTNRWVPDPQYPGEYGGFIPLPDTPGYDTTSSRFGSSHRAGVFAGYADGSVRMIAYDIDPVVYHGLGVRNDGLAQNE